MWSTLVCLAGCSLQVPTTDVCTLYMSIYCVTSVFLKFNVSDVLFLQLWTLLAFVLPVPLKLHYVIVYLKYNTLRKPDFGHAVSRSLSIKEGYVAVIGS